jgi:hypothetical protein
MSAGNVGISQTSYQFGGAAVAHSSTMPWDLRHNDFAQWVHPASKLKGSDSQRNLPAYLVPNNSTSTHTQLHHWHSGHEQQLVLKHRSHIRDIAHIPLANVFIEITSIIKCSLHIRDS